MTTPTGRPPTEPAMQSLVESFVPRRPIDFNLDFSTIELRVMAAMLERADNQTEKGAKNER